MGSDVSARAPPRRKGKTRGRKKRTPIHTLRRIPVMERAFLIPWYMENVLSSKTNIPEGLAFYKIYATMLW
jgi:hypothetical protein